EASATGIELLGEDITYEFQPLLQATDVHTPYTDGPLTLQYPAAMGTNWNDPISATYQLETIGTMTRTGTITGMVDGQGSLELPNGIYADILRIYTHYDITE